MTGLVVTFASTHDALTAEKFFHDNHVEGRIIPTPPDIYAECGLSWRTVPEEYARIESMKDMVRYSAIHTHEFRF